MLGISGIPWVWHTSQDGANEGLGWNPILNITWNNPGGHWYWEVAIRKACLHFALSKKWHNFIPSSGQEAEEIRGCTQQPQSLQVHWLVHLDRRALVVDTSALVDCLKWKKWELEDHWIKGDPGAGYGISKHITAFNKALVEMRSLVKYGQIISHASRELVGWLVGTIGS